MPILESVKYFKLKEEEEEEVSNVELDVSTKLRARRFRNSMNSFVLCSLVRFFDYGMCTAAHTQGAVLFTTCNCSKKFSMRKK